MPNTYSKENTRDDKEGLGFLLMGKTGHGKSSLGNCILGYKSFKVSSNTAPETSKVACAYSEFESCSLKVVDGPGLQDIKHSKLDDTQAVTSQQSVSKVVDK